SVRAIAYWPGDAATAPRLVYGANDKLIELDPITGNLIESFGIKGVLDVHPGQPVGSGNAARGTPNDSDQTAPRGGRGGRGRGAIGPDSGEGRGEPGAFGSGFS